MKIMGIVIEANPFHNGHKYFIDSIKEKYKPDLIIAITSTSFSMRGEISLLNKFKKTQIYLDNGIDIVLELPFPYAVQSADTFSKESIKILNKFKITDLAFGSETKNNELYEKLYKLITNSIINNDNSISKKENFNLLLRNCNFSNEEISIIESPNFTLGFQYLKFIKDNNLNINYHLIKRIQNNYHDVFPTSNIASATSIRNYLSNNKDVNQFIPYNSNKLIDVNNAEINLFNIIKYKYNVNNNYINTDFLLKEGIQNYIKNNGDFLTNYKNFIEKLKNKKYTKSVISRSILHNLIETKEITDLSCDYLRILGINSKGLSYINSLDKSVKDLIFSNPKEIKNIDSDINKILNYELTSTKLYQTIINEDLLINEYKLPIRKDD